METLSLMDLHNIKSGLIREEKYWRTTKRKLRPSEQAMSIVSVVNTRKKVEQMIAEREDIQKTTGQV